MMESMRNSSSDTAGFRFSIILLAAALIFLGCSTSQPISPRESTTLGTTVTGAGTGAIAGAGLGAPGAGAAIGGAAGAAVGAITGGKAEQQPETPKEQAESGAPASDVTGSWKGTSIASCAPGFTVRSRCGAQQRITLGLIQDGSKISGDYHCAFGNMNCRGLNDSGKVIGTYHPGRASLRIIFPDASTCLFTGRFSQRVGNGGYTCSTGGKVIEQGDWRVARQF